MSLSLYSVIKAIVKFFLKPYYRIETIGLENFPLEGSVLLCSNHISNMDPPIVGITAPRQIRFLAKEELFEVPLLKHLLPKLHAIPLKRGMSDRVALRKGLKALKEGHVLGLFPEGTRSKTGELQKGLAGAGFFALRTDAQVVPCAIIGPYRGLRKLTIVYGKPIDMTELRENRGTAEEATELIMTEIGKLIDKYQ